MVETVLKRRCDPQIVQQLWQAIAAIRVKQKLIPNQERVAKHMQKEHEMKFTDCRRELENAVADGLIEEYSGPLFKGQSGYRIPEIVDEEKGGHDWYCFACHKPGEILECSECWRVYHPECTTEDYDEPTFVCSVCKAMKQKPRIRRRQLNTLLGYTVNRLKQKYKFQTRELHKLFSREEEEKFTNFVYHYMDLNTMEAKTKARKYKYLEQFYVDAQIIYHIVIISFGDFGGMADLAKIMIRDCKYDLDEIKQCKDCYYFSNAKPQDWFAQVCRPPHELVYAKQRGFSYWPAKVIYIDDDNNYDVRFFGGYHQRAVIPKASIRPITTNLKTLAPKRTSAFVKAMKECDLHRKLLEEVDTQDPMSDGDVPSDGGEEALEVPMSPPKFHKTPKSKPKKPKEKDISISSSLAELPFQSESTKVSKAKKAAKMDKALVQLEKLTFPLQKHYGTTYSAGSSKKEPKKEKKKKKRSKDDSSSEPSTSLEFVDSLDDSLEEEELQIEPPKKQRKYRSFKDDNEDNESSMEISSTNLVSDKQALTPDNQVTSSEDKIQSPRVVSTTEISTQTSKKSDSVQENAPPEIYTEIKNKEEMTLKHANDKQGQKSTQTEVEAATSSSNSGNSSGGSCNCESKYHRMLNEYKREVQADHRKDKERALKEHEHRLRKDFEEDKQQAVTRAMSNLQREVDRVRRQTEERIRQETMEEMKKLNQKHQSELSTCKKKQWCFNCEEEAMYHCCWNTSYCSIKCQQEHWHKEHKRMCRRKR